MTTKDQLIEQHIREYESRMKHIDELFERCEFIVLVRPGFPVGDVSAATTGLPASLAERLAGNVVTGHLVEISSSDVRMRVAEGLSIRYLVPEAVAMYIYEHRLYLK